MTKRDGQGIKREKSEAMKQTEEWNTAKSRIENQIKELRHRLHTCPEISGQERKTKAALSNFWKKIPIWNFTTVAEAFTRFTEAARRIRRKRASRSGLIMMHWPYRRAARLISAATTATRRPSAARRFCWSSR